jgi:superfamily II DNA or RNA helicase
MQPRKHQQEAIRRAVKALNQFSRATILMACGTGKTLVGSKVATSISAKDIIVLVPSLALMRQVMEEWKRDDQPFSYLCVCSDKTVDQSEDSPVGVLEGLNVTSDSKDVARFLSNAITGKKVIFTTYHSAHIVGQGQSSGHCFDFGLFDEAHKTAGILGKPFGLALHDANVKIRKRLFMTATPRHYVPSNDESSVNATYSMDDEEIYGKVCYSLPFVKAVRLRIIVDYKVLICVVTKKEVDEELETAPNPEAALGRLAIKKAARNYNVSKVIAFNSGVSAAMTFASSCSSLPGFTTTHVNGTMPVVERTEALDLFKRSTKAIVTNARCLTEGVDLPTVDMIAFLSPRGSTIDIVQAVGRAMRKSPGKRVGYILLPVLVENDDSASTEEALRGTKFERVWEVLRCLQEQDEILSCAIEDLGRDLGERGEIEEETRKRARSRVVLMGSRLPEEAFDVQCVKRLGELWDVRFGQLKSLMQSPGKAWSLLVGDEQLDRWCKSQRHLKKKGLLSRRKIQRLEGIGFKWDITEADVKEFYHQRRQKIISSHVDEALRFIETNNAHPSLSSKNASEVSLAGRLAYARHLARIGKLDEALRLKVASIPPSRKAPVTDLKRGLQMLKEYLERRKSSTEPVLMSKFLSRWLARVRKRFNKTLSSEERDAVLDAGFDPTVNYLRKDNVWEKNFQELKRRLSAGERYPSAKEGDLGHWVHTQRSHRQQGKLAKDREQLLNSIGFSWIAANWRLSFKTHGFHGISRQRNKWRANWYANGKHYHKGGFSSAEEAARARDRIIKSLPGNKSKLNFQ